MKIRNKVFFWGGVSLMSMAVFAGYVWMPYLIELVVAPPALPRFSMDAYLIFASLIFGPATIAGIYIHKGIRKRDLR